MMIQSPKIGTPLKASWAQAVTERVNALAPVGASRLLVREGARGFGFDALPPNLRDRRGGVAAADAGCWRLVTATQGGSTVHVFDNQYYKAGEVVLEASLATTAESLVGSQLYFIALQISADGQATPAIVGYATFAAMSTASRTRAMVIKPLYRLDANCNIVCDFRNIPEAQIAEILS